ncbi:MAG: rod shape-determining protein [Candidatus Paceibacterota bacterium]
MAKKLNFNFWRKGIGIDLGTANTLVYVDGRGIVINEPTYVAINEKTGKVMAVGMEAKDMLGRTPLNIKVIRPLVDGVISDFEMAQEIVSHLLRRVNTRGGIFNLFHSAVVSVPSDLTEVERKSVEDAVVGSGVAKAYIIESSLAAALGARLPVHEPVANMIVDIGAGTTEIAIISMGGTVTVKSLRIAGDKLNDDIMKFVRDEYHLAIGVPTAEQIKIEIGSVLPQDEMLTMSIRGRDLASGLPKEVTLKENQIRTAISKSVSKIVDAVREVIEVSPPELVGDILRQGIYMCGGTSLLRGMDALIQRELNVKTHMVEDPLTCVARGTGVAVENIEKYEHILDNPLKPKDIKL